MTPLHYLTAAVVAGALAVSAAADARGFAHGERHSTDTAQHRLERQIDRRQARQWDRIKNGIDSGRLSRGEAKRLIRSHKRIARMEDRFERDGYYSPREQRKIERTLDRTSKGIKHAKRHDRPHHSPHRAWRHWRHHRRDAVPYAYEAASDVYLAESSSSASISAQTDGFSISWSTSRQE